MHRQLKEGEAKRGIQRLIEGIERRRQWLADVFAKGRLQCCRGLLDRLHGLLAFGNEDVLLVQRGALLIEPCLQHRLGWLCRLVDQMLPVTAQVLADEQITPHAPPFGHRRQHGQQGEPHGLVGAKALPTLEIRLERIELAL